jgi:hypothetical protein
VDGLVYFEGVCGLVGPGVCGVIDIGGFVKRER